MRVERLKLSYEWHTDRQGSVEVIVHLEDGSSFALSPTAAKKRYGISQAVQQKQER